MPFAGSKKWPIELTGACELLSAQELVRLEFDLGRVVLAEGEGGLLLREPGDVVERLTEVHVRNLLTLGGLFPPLKT